MVVRNNVIILSYTRIKDTKTYFQRKKINDKIAVLYFKEQFIV